MTIGKLPKLTEKEIRTIWPTEAKQFSPWLADNIFSLNLINERHLRILYICLGVGIVLIVVGLVSLLMQ